jgi:hypothetical protein
MNVERCAGYTPKSKRGAMLEWNEIKNEQVRQVFDTVHKLDDFGIVTVHTEIIGYGIRFLIESTNIGFSIRTHVNGMSMPGHNGILQGSDKLSSLFPDVIDD